MTNLLSSAWLCRTAVCVFLALGAFQAAVAQESTELVQQRIDTALPDVDVISEPEGEYNVRTLYAGEEVVGYSYQSIDVTTIPAYSGKPINLHVILDPLGVIVDAYVLEHHEPILLIGIPEQKLHDFTSKYTGVSVNQRVVVGRSRDENAVTVDAVSGATVTVMVVNEIVMGTAHTVAVSLGLVEETSGVGTRPATVRDDVYQEADWETLTGNGAIRRLRLTHGQIDEAFRGTPAEGIDEAGPDQADTTFIDLYVAHLNPPTIGRNLLGDNQYRFLMEDLEPGEHAIAVMGRGDYSYKGSGYVRGGIFDRLQLRQFGEMMSFRDLDHDRLSDVYAAGTPDFDEKSIFIGP